MLIWKYRARWQWVVLFAALAIAPALLIPATLSAHTYDGEAHQVADCHAGDEGSSRVLVPFRWGVNLGSCGTVLPDTLTFPVQIILADGSL